LNPASPTYRGVSDEVLDQGPGLFGAAQLPSAANANVSIAAHRDIGGQEFRDVDKLAEGDYIYLTYRGVEYAYLFEDSFTTHAYDWEPIRTKDYPCVTLQSCTPVLLATHRIFVVGRLVGISATNT
jgi:sortase A